MTFGEWRSWYEVHAEPADPIEGASLYYEPVHGFFYYKVVLQYARGKCIFENRRMLWI